MKIKEQKNTRIPSTRTTIGATFLVLLTFGSLYKISSPSEAAEQVPISVSHNAMTGQKSEVSEAEMNSKIINPMIKVGLIATDSKKAPQNIEKFAELLYLFKTGKQANSTPEGKNFIKVVQDGWKLSEKAWKENESKFKGSPFEKFYSTFAKIHAIKGKNAAEKKLRHNVNIFIYGALDHYVENYVSFVNSGEYWDFDINDFQGGSVTGKKGDPAVLKKFPGWFQAWAESVDLYE